MALQEYYNLDINEIKDDIKTFLSTHTDFQDANFEGSALSQLLDVLAYITQTQAFYLNQSLNEITLKNAQITTNIYKLANMLNYTIKRKSAPYIDITVQRNDTVTIIIPKYSTWTMGSLTLVNLEDITINDGSVYSVRLYEGTVDEELFDSDGSEFQIFELEESIKVDNDILYVYVDNPDGSGGYILNTTPWINANTEPFNTDDNAYYIELFEGLNIKFDNGNLFNIPGIGDRVRINYLNTNGTLYNGATGTITLTDTDVANRDKIDITNNDVLKNGTDEEDADAIKLRAPLFYTTQNRAITEDDYNILIKKWSKYDILDSAIIWGGEKEFIDNSGNIIHSSLLKDLGHVYISALKSDYDYLSSSEITELETFLTKYKIITLFFEFLDPVFIQITPTINIKYGTKVGFNITDVETQINTHLATLNSYDTSFYLSNLINYVDDIDNITYNYITYTTRFKAKHQDHKVIRLNNAITAGSITGTINGFTMTDDGAGVLNWNGNPVGSVDYTDGFIVLDSTFGGLTTSSTYTIQFTYSDIQKITLEKESFLYFNSIILNPIS